MKLKLPQVTLLGIDCVNVERLQAAMDISEKDIKFGEVKLLTSLPTEDPRLIKISPIGSMEEFSVFCIKDLVNYVDTEYVLLVQYDGFILNPESWTPDFLKYDYLGAPLSWGQKKVEGVPLKFSVGNGGFCLRSKRFLEASARFVKEGKITRFDPEDAALCVWYRGLFEKEGMEYAPADLGMKFSVVEDYGVYDRPFGFHGLFNKNMDTLINRYPDFPVHFFLPRIKSKAIEKIAGIFKQFAMEGFVVRSDEPQVWLIFREDKIKEILERRAELYSQIREVIKIDESFQDHPANGMHSSVAYRSKVGSFKIHFYLCSTVSTVPNDRKKIF